MRSELLTEPSSCFFGFPHVDNAKSVRTFAGGMDKQPLDRPIRRRLGAILPHHAPNDLVVTLPRHVGSLVNKHDRRRYLL